MKTKIYAVKDRLLEYFMQPFAAPGDKEVMGALATTINRALKNEEPYDIAQAPHHFEIWELGEVDEDGHIIPSRRLICDCSSLVRGDIRRTEETNEGGNKAVGYQEPDPGEASDTGGRSGAIRGPVPDHAPASRSEAPKENPGRGGSTQNPNSSI